MEQKTRILVAALLLCLNIIAAFSLGTLNDLKKDFSDLRKDVGNLNIRVFGAEKDISALQGQKTRPIIAAG